MSSINQEIIRFERLLDDMIGNHWSTRQIAFGAFVMGFLADMLFRVFVFEESFGIFLFIRASIMGFVWVFIFVFVSPQTSKK